MRRHVPLKQAHTAITALLVEPSVIVELPMLEDAKAFEPEVEAHGAVATRIEVPEEVDVKIHPARRWACRKKRFAHRFGLDLADRAQLGAEAVATGTARASCCARSKRTRCGDASATAA